MSELTVDGLGQMKKSEFVKEFKNKAIWKRANAVIVLVDYPLDGKKTTVAIPFKKESEMKAEMKRIKKEKLHIIKKSGGGSIAFDKAADGKMQAKIELQIGGLKMETLIAKGQKLFNVLKVNIAATQSAEAVAEATAAAQEEGAVEEDDNQETDDDYGDDAVDMDATEESNEETATVTMTPEQRAKKLANLQKINENLDKLLSKVLK